MSIFQDPLRTLGRAQQQLGANALQTKNLPILKKRQPQPNLQDSSIYDQSNDQSHSRDNQSNSRSSQFEAKVQTESQRYNIGSSTISASNIHNSSVSNSQIIDNSGHQFIFNFYAPFFSQSDKQQAISSKPRQASNQPTQMRNGNIDTPLNRSNATPLKYISHREEQLRFLTLLGDIDKILDLSISQNQDAMFFSNLKRVVRQTGAVGLLQQNATINQNLDTIVLDQLNHDDVKLIQICIDQFNRIQDPNKTLLLIEDIIVEFKNRLGDTFSCSKCSLIKLDSAIEKFMEGTCKEFKDAQMYLISFQLVEQRILGGLSYEEMKRFTSAMSLFYKSVDFK